MTETPGTNASGDGQSNQPQTRAVAVALQVRPDRLREFIDCHPNPTADAVLALADRPPADQETRDMVAEWVESKATDTEAGALEERAGGGVDGLAGLTRGGER